MSDIGEVPHKLTLQTFACLLAHAALHEREVGQLDRNSAQEEHSRCYGAGSCCWGQATTVLIQHGT